MESIRLVHISDIHITARSFRWFPEDWFNKRLPAWFNLRWLGRGITTYDELWRHLDPGETASSRDQAKPSPHTLGLERAGEQPRLVLARLWCR